MDDDIRGKGLYYLERKERLSRPKFETWSDLVRAATCAEDLGLPKIDISPRQAILEISRKQYEEFIRYNPSWNRR